MQPLFGIGDISFYSNDQGLQDDFEGWCTNSYPYRPPLNFDDVFAQEFVTWVRQTAENQVATSLIAQAAFPSTENGDGGTFDQIELPQDFALMDPSEEAITEETQLDEAITEETQLDEVSHAPLETPEAIGRVERHGGALKAMARKVVAHTQAVGPGQLQTVLDECCLTKNSMLRHGGYSPSEWVLGKTPRGPPSFMEENSGSDLGSFEDQVDPESRFALLHKAREEAKKAFMHLDTSKRVQRALLRNAKPLPYTYSIGDVVCFRRDKTGKTEWSTASRVIGFEGTHNESVWVLCQNVPVLVSAQNLRPAQDAEALAQAVLQGEPILPDGLTRGNVWQNFEDLRGVPGEGADEQEPEDVDVEPPQEDDDGPSYGLLDGPGPLASIFENDVAEEQAERGFWRKVDREARDAGFEVSRIFPAFYFHRHNREVTCVLTTHVDDFLWASKGVGGTIVNKLLEKFEVGRRESGRLHFCGKHFDKVDHDVVIDVTDNTNKIHYIEVKSNRRHSDPIDRGEERQLRSVVGSLLGRLEAERSKLRRQAEEARRQAADRSEDLDRLERQRTSHGTTVATLEQQIDEFRRQLRDRSQELARQKAEHQKAQQQLDEARMVEEQKTKLAASAKEAQKRASELTWRLEAANKEVEGSRERCKDLEQQLQQRDDKVRRNDVNSLSDMLARAHRHAELLAKMQAELGRKSRVLSEEEQESRDQLGTLKQKYEQKIAKLHLHLSEREACERKLKGFIENEIDILHQYNKELEDYCRWRRGGWLESACTASGPLPSKGQRLLQKLQNLEEP
eukprot:s5218_g6.t1